MAKTLQTLIATTLITATLYSPIHAEKRKRGGLRNMGEHATNEIGDALGQSLKEGIVGGLANPGGIFGPQNMKPDKDKGYYFLDKEGQIEYKRREESHAFRYILSNINQKPSEEGNLLKSIIENPQKYHNSLSPEELREFNEFWKGVDEKNNRNKIVFSHGIYIPWKLIYNQLDLVEMHILYQLDTRKEAMDRTKEDKENYRKNYDRFSSFRWSLKLSGIDKYLSEKMR